MDAHTAKVIVMKQIKFSHWYYKLANVYDRHQRDKKAKLLQAVKIHYNDLSKQLIDFDVTYGEHEQHQLPKTDLIFLIFEALQYTGGLFTTIRRYTPEKWKHYKSSQGEIFEVVIEE